MAEITMQELMEREIGKKIEFSAKYGIDTFNETILMTDNAFGIALTILEKHGSYALYCRAVHDSSTDKAVMIRAFSQKKKAVAAFKALTV